MFVALKRHRLLSAAVVALATVAALGIAAFSTDGLAATVLGLVLAEDTAYGTGYTDAGFAQVRRGMPTGQVRTLIGPPIYESWIWTAGRGGCRYVVVEGGRVAPPVSAACGGMKVLQGQGAEELTRLLGHPDTEHWVYSYSPSSTHYRERVIVVAGGVVTRVKTGLYLD